MGLLFLLYLTVLSGETIKIKNETYYKTGIDYCNKHELWIGFARVRGQSITREETMAKVLNILEGIISNDNSRTKGSLMRMVRELYEGDSAYTDVGKVAGKIIEQQLMRTGKWARATSSNFIRIRK